MLPLYLLNASKGAHVLVEQKSRATVEGRLENVDFWMNVTVVDAVCTAADGTKHTAERVYVRGVQIKLIKLPNDVVDHFKEQQLREKEHNNRNRRNNNQQGQQQGQRRYNNNNGNNNNRRNNNQHRNNNNNRNNQQQQTATASA